jgi:hypothetical protein
MRSSNGRDYSAALDAEILAAGSKRPPRCFAKNSSALAVEMKLVRREKQAVIFVLVDKVFDGLVCAALGLDHLLRFTSTDTEVPRA